MDDDVAAVRRAVDRLLEGDQGPLLDLLADDVELEVARGAGTPARTSGTGREAVTDYFTPIEALAAFWQIDVSASGGQVIAWGKERFTIHGCGLEGACEFALVFDLAHGRVTRLLVIEDLPSFMREGGRVPRREAA